MTTPRRTPHIVFIALVSASVALTGCTSKQDPSTAPTVNTVLDESADPNASALPSTSASPTGTGSTGGGGPVAPTYPSTAKGYSQALLSAWGQKNFTRIDQLAIQSTVQQIKDSGYPNSQWTYISCTAVDSNYHQCVFRNAHGDEATLKLTTAQLGHPTAVVEALLERTTYPSAAGDYVNQFINAWRNGNRQRMTRLANSTLTSYFSSQTPPNGLNIDAGYGETSTHIKVRVSEVPGGQEWIFKVAKAYLGKSHAISGTCAYPCA